MLPVFFTLLWSYHLLYNGHVARGTSMSNARMGAWQTSMEGCAFGDTRNTTTCVDCDSGGAGATAEVGETGDLFSGLLGEIPFLGSLLRGLFGPMVSGAGNVAYTPGYRPREGLSNGGNIDARMDVVCNSQRESLADILKRAVCSWPAVGTVLSFLNFCP
ncbi:MAG: hypothetical protein AAF411_19560 [Myxococcota bacterium]